MRVKHEHRRLLGAWLIVVGVNVIDVVCELVGGHKCQIAHAHSILMVRLLLLLLLLLGEMMRNGEMRRRRRRRRRTCGELFDLDSSVRWLVDRLRRTRDESG